MKLAREEDIEERGEPSLVFFRRANPASPVELVVVEKGRTLIWQMPPQAVLPCAADLVRFAATGHPVAGEIAARE